MNLDKPFKFKYRGREEVTYHATLCGSGMVLVDWENSDGSTTEVTFSTLEALNAIRNGSWTVVDEPEEQGEETTYYIVSNEIQCNTCGESIFSMHRHHFVECKCGGCAVDGGQAYLRRVGSDYTEKSIKIDERALTPLVADVEASRKSGRNDLGVTLALLRSIRDNNLVETSQGKWDIVEK